MPKYAPRPTPQLLSYLVWKVSMMERQRTSSGLTSDLLLKFSWQERDLLISKLHHKNPLQLISTAFHFEEEVFGMRLTMTTKHITDFVKENDLEQLCTAIIEIYETIVNQTLANLTTIDQHGRSIFGGSKLHTEALAELSKQCLTKELEDFMSLEPCLISLYRCLFLTYFRESSVEEANQMFDKMVFPECDKGGGRDRGLQKNLRTTNQLLDQMQHFLKRHGIEDSCPLNPKEYTDVLFRLFTLAHETSRRLDIVNSRKIKSDVLKHSLVVQCTEKLWELPERATRCRPLRWVLT